MRYQTLCAAAVTLAVLTSSPKAQQKQAIERADQLPANSYPISKAPSALLHDEKGLAELMRSLRADLESDLAKYEIRDSATLRSYYRTLSRIALFEHRLDDALDYENRAAALEDKPAARMVSAVMFRPLVAAEKAEAEEAAQAFSKSLKAELAQLRYDSVRADLNEIRGALQKQSAAFLEGAVVHGIDPAARAGSISRQQAMQLLGFKFGLRRVPYYDEIVRQLSALDAAHLKPESDIWGARDVSLEGRPGLAPIVVAIWDCGVDTAIFPGRVWTNAKEVPDNRKDDDGNGYVDDVHGIAWAWDGKPRVGDLPPLEVSPEDIAKAKQFQAGPQEAKRVFAGLSKEEVIRLSERIKFYNQHYAHGTHVAGIAVQGNPAARLLVVRMDDPTRQVAPPATAAWAAAFARAISRSIEYYRNAGVRVVNMSWYVSSAELEETLNSNGVGATQQERHQLAMQSFDTVRSAFRAAIAAAPEILFVCGAGNSTNKSNQFEEFVPASFDLPNTITVGAVGEAGDETRFTTLGKVDVYANGFEVESVVPGGDKVRMSGTSMASPQVVNLAAKLLALHPQLTTAALRKLIIDGTDTKDVSNGRSIRLLNEVRSFQLADALR